MPMKPPTFRPSHLPTPEQAVREYEQQRRASKPWRKWYYTERWKRLRAAQLALQPLCEVCLETPQRLITAADTVHHKRPHRGDPALFYDASNLQSACKRCHDGELQAREKRR